MGTAIHVEHDQKELVRDVHRLYHVGVQLVNSTKVGVMVHNASKSSTMADI